MGSGAFGKCKDLKTAVVGAGITKLNESLFTDCVSLEKVTLTAKKTEANNKAFYNCRSLSELDYSKTELEFRALTFEKCYSLKDMDLVFLKRPSSTMTLTTEKAAVDGTVEFTVDFDVIAGHYLDSTDFTVALTIPEGVTVLSDSFSTDAGEVSMNAISELKIPFDKSKGKLTFSARATEPGTYDIDADLIFKDADKDLGTRKEPIHSVRFTADILSLSAPSTVNSLETKVSGTGPKGQKVDVYLGDKVIGSPVADERTGKFELAVTLPESKDGDKFVIKAKYGDVETSDHTIVYSKEEPAINSIMLGINGNAADRDITEVFTKCISPVMYINTGREYSFAIDISNSENVDRVFITSTKEDKIAKLEAKYDEDTKLWSVKGYFDGNKNYVPGSLNIVVVSKDKELKAAKLDIDYKDAYYSRQGDIRFVIDPSGIVYEGAPSNAVKGAEMTIYYMDEDGKAVVWDGTDFDQMNPILTDEFGAYAWNVPEGDWKVVCKAEGFETMESDWTEVPPAQKDINFSLVSSEAPKVTDISLDGEDISLKFSKYMLPDTVSVGNVSLDAGSDIEITPVYHDDSEQITDTFTISGDFTDVYDVKVSVSNGCHSYSDAAAVASEKTVHIKDDPKASTTTTTTTATTTTTTTTTKATTTTTQPTTTTTKATTTTTQPTTTTTKATTTTAQPTTTTTKATTTTTQPTTTTTKATTTTATTTTAPMTTTQPVTKKSLGDIDGNGILDAVDASKILGSYAKFSTGAGKPTQDDLDVCDVNKDGFIDAVDASKVLSYYAYLSTTKEDPVSFESFLKK